MTRISYVNNGKRSTYLTDILLLLSRYVKLKVIFTLVETECTIIIHDNILIHID